MVRIRLSSFCLALLVAFIFVVFPGCQKRPVPQLELYPTLSAVGLEIIYPPGLPLDTSASFRWRKAGEKEWHNGVDLTVNAEQRLAWGSIWPLEQGTEVEVRVDFNQSGRGEPLTGTTRTREMVLEPRVARPFTSPRPAAMTLPVPAKTRSEPWNALPVPPGLEMLYWLWRASTARVTCLLPCRVAPKGLWCSPPGRTRSLCWTALWKSPKAQVAGKKLLKAYMR